MNYREDYLSAMDDYSRRQAEVMKDLDASTEDYNATAHHVVRAARDYIDYLEGRVHQMTFASFRSI